MNVILLGTTLAVLVLFVIRAVPLERVNKIWRSVEEWFHVYQFFKVPEFNEAMQENHLYKKVSIYLHSLPSIQDTDFTNLLTSSNNQYDILLRLGPNQTIQDNFRGAILFWFNHHNSSRTFLLKIRKVDRRRILRPYLHHIHAVAHEIMQNRDLRLFIMNANGTWRSVPFTHPSTFDTITMESDLKNRVKSDLESFLRAKQYYHRLGRVWKRSFLLYGPSGTGKSSFVAAMANFLSYDVYDIDLSKFPSDSDMKFLLLQTTPKSMIVVEDLDRVLAEKSTGGF